MSEISEFRKGSEQTLTKCVRSRSCRVDEGSQRSVCSNTRFSQLVVVEKD